MVWFAEEVILQKVLGIPALSFHLNLILQVMVIADSISLMKPEGLFQINCIIGKIVGNSFFPFFYKFN